jgi:acetylglutamate kinase
MAEKGVKANFVRGLRVTDEASMDVVEQVLNREVNVALVQTLEKAGCTARGIHGEDILSVSKHTERDEKTGDVLEWGYVGDVDEVDDDPILAYLHAHIVPVITPLGRGDDDHLYNINADDAASAIAQTLKARKLVFLSDVPGCCADPADKTSLISTLKIAEVDGLIERGGDRRRHDPEGAGRGAGHPGRRAQGALHRREPAALAAARDVHRPGGGDGNR